MGAPHSKLTFDEIPEEILYLIFDKISLTTLFYSVRPVCKRFARILSSDNYFKLRFKRIYMESHEYPLLKYYGLDSESEHWKSGQDIFWTDLAVRTDVRQQAFGTTSVADVHYTQTLYSDPHIATVDAVHLFNNGHLCVSGGRDRLLCLRNLLSGSVMYCVQDAHKGWIWDIKSHSHNMFFTCGWDGFIKQWIFGCEIRMIQEMNLLNDRPMCLSTEPGLIISGMHNGQILLLDPRIGTYRPVHRASIHRGSIIKIQKCKNELASIGEDRKLAVYDLRNQRILLRKHANPGPKDGVAIEGIEHYDSCPRSLGLYRDLLYVGDSRGYMQIFEAHSNFDHVMTSKIGYNRALNAIVPSLEGVIAGTADVGLRFVVPSKPCRVVGQFDFEGEVTSVDHMKKVIVAGCTNSTCTVHVFNSLL